MRAGRCGKCDGSMTPTRISESVLFGMPGASRYNTGERLPVAEKVKKTRGSWIRFKKQIVIKLTDELYDSTKKVAEKWKVTPSEVARRALERYVTELGFPPKEPKNRLP